MLNSPQVALDCMNRDHAEFVTMRRQLPGRTSSQASETGVGTLLDGLSTSMSARSERRKQGHDTVAPREGPDRDGGDWFVNRVNNMDFVTAGFLKAQDGERT